MEIVQVVQRARLLALIEQLYAHAGNGRPLYAKESMLRIHLLQT
ncbi:hypothetical protein ACFW0H_13885 [Pseudomonas sp. CR3202]